MGNWHPASPFYVTTMRIERFKQIESTFEFYPAIVGSKEITN